MNPEVCGWIAVDVTIENCQCSRLFKCRKFCNLQLFIFQKIYCLSKALWLHQFRVYSAPFQFYNHLLLTILNWECPLNPKTKYWDQAEGRFEWASEFNQLKFKIERSKFRVCIKLISISIAETEQSKQIWAPEFYASRASFEQDFTQYQHYIDLSLGINL